MQARRRAGLRSFPEQPPAECAYPASDPKPPCATGCSRAQGPSGVTITAFGDTTGVIMPAGGFFVNPGVAATVTVSGVGSDTLPNAVVFVFQGPPLGPS